MSLLYKTAVFFAVVSTLTLGIQSTFGWAWFLSSVDERSDTYACRAFASFISSSLVLSLSTLLILINLYWHSVETIFNRKAPSFPSMDFFSSFWTHSCLIRPYCGCHAHSVSKIYLGLSDSAYRARFGLLLWCVTPMGPDLAKLA